MLSFPHPADLLLRPVHVLRYQNLQGGNTGHGTGGQEREQSLDSIQFNFISLALNPRYSLKGLNRRYIYDTSQLATSDPCRLTSPLRMM